MLVCLVFMNLPTEPSMKLKRKPLLAFDSTPASPEASRRRRVSPVFFLSIFKGS